VSEFALGAMNFGAMGNGAHGMCASPPAQYAGLMSAQIRPVLPILFSANTDAG
jgi:hypothetical protein